MPFSDHTFAVVLAGGGGTRLWPKSRTKTPKQFLKLVGDETMIQVATKRITQFIPWERIIVVTNELYKDDVQQQLPEVSPDHIIAEPMKRDTALAMLTGALFAQSLDPEAIVVNLASDHIVTDKTEFLRVMKAAAKVASESDVLVSVGIRPTFPSSGFGYIKIGSDLKKLDKGLSLFAVDSFTEKPNVPTAQAFISTGRYFWNANMYVWSTSSLVAAFRKYMPQMAELTQPLSTASIPEFHASLPDLYKQAEAISIDYAISEKADNLVLIPGDFGWNDVGDWKVVYDLGSKNKEGNVIMGEHAADNAIVLNSYNNLVHTNGRLVALYGVSDLIVIDTDEILMVIPKKQSQDVKKIVEHLKAEEREEYQ